MEDFPTLWKVLDRLDGASIPYILTGSMALNFYGHVRGTNDIDLVVQLGPLEVAKVIRLFEKDFYISEVAVREAVEKEWMFNLIDTESIFKVDCIVARKDPYSREQFSRRRSMTVGPHCVSVISPEDLILSKLDWSRESLSEMQENDIKSVLRVSGPALDWNYLRKWAKEKGLQERLEKLHASL